ncbi:MAG: outer membrane lipoprotein chaperone LolA [Deltaproteobacteria bacterium]
MSKISISFILIFALTAFIWAQEEAESKQAKKPSLERIITKIEANYGKISDFHAKFTQEATVKILDQVEVAEGEVWLKKPGKMRWNYYTPNKEQIVSDGATMWFYNDKDNQVIESSVGGIAQGGASTTSLLSGFQNIRRQFDTRFSTESFPGEKGNYLIDLMPKKGDDDEESRVTIAVNKKNLFVETVYLFDAFGNMTKVKLSEIKTNKGAADSLFKFEAPEGVDVIKAPAY